MKQNYIVCHYLNGKLIGRWDFGKDFHYAKDHVEFIANSVYQKGKHQIVAMDEYQPFKNERCSKCITI